MVLMMRSVVCYAVVEYLCLQSFVTHTSKRITD